MVISCLFLNILWQPVSRIQKEMCSMESTESDSLWQTIQTTLYTRPFNVNTFWKIENNPIFELCEISKYCKHLAQFDHTCCKSFARIFWNWSFLILQVNLSHRKHSFLSFMDHRTDLFGPKECIELWFIKIVLPFVFFIFKYLFWFKKLKYTASPTFRSPSWLYHESWHPDMLLVSIAYDSVRHCHF